MPKVAPPRLRFSIRFKLLLVASSLLIIPIIGTKYIREMEDYLRHQQEEALLTRTQMVAAVFQGKPDLFKTQSGDARRATCPDSAVTHADPTRRLPR